MPVLDLEPAAREIKELINGVSDDRLGGPTPCDMPLAALLDHLMGLSRAFTDAAHKTNSDESRAEVPPPSADRLDPDWRNQLPERLDQLVDAWRAPAAWDGTTQAGGITMPADQMGVVALDELVLHGWDLARATGQTFHADEASTAAILSFTTEMAKPEYDDQREGLFGPVVDVANDASDLGRALGFAGRDPAWMPQMAPHEGTNVAPGPSGGIAPLADASPGPGPSGGVSQRPPIASNAGEPTDVARARA